MILYFFCTALTYVREIIKGIEYFRSVVFY